VEWVWSGCGVGVKWLWSGYKVSVEWGLECGLEWAEGRVEVVAAPDGKLALMAYATYAALYYYGIQIWKCEYMNATSNKFNGRNKTLLVCAVGAVTNRHDGRGSIRERPQPERA